jgi:hypothetical protein
MAFPKFNKLLKARDLELKIEVKKLNFWDSFLISTMKIDGRDCKNVDTEPLSAMHGPIGPPRGISSNSSLQLQTTTELRF